MPDSREPRQPNSPSTDTPTACAISTTLACHVDVVFIAGGRLHVLLQGPIHHHAGEAGVGWKPGTRPGSRRDPGASPPVCAARFRQLLRSMCLRKASPAYLRAPAEACRITGLSVSGGLHDRLHLLHIVHVESRHAVVMLGGVIEQLAHGYEWHGSLRGSFRVNRIAWGLDHCGESTRPHWQRPQ